MPMENRVPKNRCNGGAAPDPGKSAGNSDALKLLESAMDQRAAGIAQTVTDMFRFMSMASAMLLNMEMDTGLFRLKVDDGGIFFEINHPFRKRKQRDISNDCCAEEPDNYDDDEEGLIYDGD